MKNDNKENENYLSEEFLSKLNKYERDFIVSWKELYENKSFKKKLDKLKGTMK